MSRQQQITDKLWDGGVHPDRVIAHKDGTFSGWFGFFYRHGATADGHAARVVKAIPAATILEAYEDWQAWPKDSYFKVRFSLPKDDTR